MISLKEIFIPVKDFEGYYEVSNFGNVRSLERIIRNKNGKELKVRSRILIPRKHRNGYTLVNLCKNNIIKNCTIHKIVCQSFLGDRPNLIEINHKDGNKKNNILDNLEYVTRSDNSRHAYRLGLKFTKGSKCSAAKLTEEDVIEIRRSYLSREYNQVQLGKKYGVKANTICNIINRRYWTHI